MRNAQKSKIFFPLMKNNINVDDLKKVKAFLSDENIILTQSSNVEKFEKKWSEWLGVKYSVFVNSGITTPSVPIRCCKARMRSAKLPSPPKESRCLSTKDKMPSLIASADAVIISLKDVPLFRYGVSPNKLYDAYAIGRPVITTIPGHINEEVKRNQWVVVLLNIILVKLLLLLLN